MLNIYVTNAYSNVAELNSGKFRNQKIETDKINNILMGGSRIGSESKEVITFTDGEYSIVLDGSIYNRDELKITLSGHGIEFNSVRDEELLLKAYVFWGQEAFSKVNGIFSLVIYNAKRNEIISARDRLGVKPLYYSWQEGLFQICSKLLPIAGQNRNLSEEAVSAYLSCGYVPSPYTIIENVSKLQPGCILKLDLNNNTKEIIKYWKLAHCTINDISYEDAKARVHELLKDVVRIMVDEDEDFACFLSGGIDSALITAIATKLTEKKIKSFESSKYDESKVALQFSDILNTEHHIEILTKEKFIELLPAFIKAYDEPFGNSSAFPTMLLNSTTKKYVTTALAGDGGDEGFLGYSHFDSINKFKRLNKIPFILRKTLSIFLPRNNRFKTILTIKNEDAFIERIFVGNQELLKTKQYNWLDTSYSDYKYLSKDSIQKAADLNIELSVENDSNVKIDRASRAYGLQVRSPFLDYRIVELARCLPIEFRFSDGIRKKILRDILEIYIPREIFEQPKKGFSIPLSDWLRTVLKDDIELQLNDHTLNLIPNLNLKKFKKMMRQHFDNKCDHSTLIWRVYVLALWISANESH